MTDALDAALDRQTSPEFEKWWNGPSINHAGRGMVGGSVKTNGDFVMSIWGNPWMRVHAAEIFNAGALASEEHD